MATNKDTVKIEINIAGEFLRLSVPFEDQDRVRRCEKAINDLYLQWRVKFPRKTTSELVAMLAYQYASFYLELSDRYEALSDRIAEISDNLDSALKGFPPEE